jgi:hypothetical protein
MTVLWTTLGTSGATYLLAIAARNQGKTFEPKLWELWGGAPTTQLLRHSGPANSVLRERWHKSLGKMLKKRIPTPSEEKADPKAADLVYVAATRLLINARRDTKAYPLIYKENVNYGFCRNLYALKYFGIGAAIAGCAISLGAGIRCMTNEKGFVLPLACLLICILMLLLWVYFVNASLVKIPAFAYAERLLESSEFSPKTTK